VRAGARVEAWSVPYGPSDARALLHTPQRTGSTSGRQAQAALFSLVRYVNSYVRARSALVPAVRRCGGFERAQRPARPRGDAKRPKRSDAARRTPAAVAAHARNRTLSAREIRHQRDDRTHHVSNSPTLILILNHFGTSDVSG